MSTDHNGDRRERRGGLEAALRGADPPLPADDDEIAAYVDGTLDDVAREIFETRLADDPTLQAEVRELQQLRASLDPTPSRQPAVGSASRPWLAAAAGLLLILGGMWWLTSSRPSPVRLADAGGELVVQADGTVGGAPSVPVDLQRLVGDALQRGRLPVAGRLDRLRVDERPLMGGGDPPAFQLTSPVGIVVAVDRPRFRWRPLTGATSYRVSVHDEALALVAAEADLTATEWTPLEPLPRGMVLLWQVEATTPNGRVLAPSPADPQARFEVMPAPEQQALERRLAAAGPGHMARAVVFTQAGLIDEARAEIEALRPANPGATVLDALLASLDHHASPP